MTLQREWMLLHQYEEKVLAPSIPTSVLMGEIKISTEKIQEVQEFLLVKEEIEIEKEIYLMIFNAGIDLKES